MNQKYRKWTAEEEDRLLQQVKLFPQNLSKCFKIVSEVIGRSPEAVTYHWYNVVSKRPKTTCFFTASPKQVSKNRKNGGAGMKSNKSVWRRLLSIIINL